MSGITKIILAAVIIVSGIGYTQFAGKPISFGSFEFISEAQARRGRVVAPAVRVSGVARRTTRRTIRRGAYLATIPRGCAYGTYYGYSLYHCGGTYYQKSGSGYVIVYF